MRAKLSLRIAAVIILLHTVGHTLGALTWRQAPNARVAAVIAGMNREHFSFMGRSASLALFFNGYSTIMIFVLLLISVLLWLLSVTPVKSMILVFGVFLVLAAIAECIYFFPLAAGMTLIAGIFTLLAIRSSDSKPSNS